MNTRPIGVFDSGLGGLTAMHTLGKRLPNETFIYFGDTARVPYGGRSEATLLKYARQDVAFLKSFKPKVLVIACGTVSTTCLEQLQQENSLPIIGVVEPTCLQALHATKNGRIGMIATQASVRSGAYERMLHRLDPDVDVFCHPCPLLVPMVENGRMHRGDIVIETLVKEYLAPLKAKGIDTLMLGCTHYPLLWDVIGKEMGPSVTLISAGAAVATAVETLLEDSHMEAPQTSDSHRSFYVSDEVESFTRNASLFLQEDLHQVVRRIDIDQY
ncbi:glutamate racemase [Bengtsoniella intestinalis]|uniref:glutamate racemase n=1 Tax=Bengtsoniella intestinalis TaxID=3073143 RepID=UPI00391F0299